MKILIIGGTSFIGPSVVKQLNELGNHQINLFHRGRTRLELPPNVKEILGNKAQLGQYMDEFKKVSPDVVVDMIAFSEEDTRVVADTFKGITDRLVTISSQDVYRAFEVVKKANDGPLEPMPITENSVLRSNRFPYKDPTKSPEEWCNKYDKILVEDVVMNTAYIKGTILRLPAVYGPRDPQIRLFNYLKLKPMHDGRPFILIDQSFADWVWSHSFVENAAYAIALAITNEQSIGRIYNVGEMQSPTMLEYIQTIGGILNWKGKVVIVDRLPKELTFPFNTQQPLSVDPARICEELGYKEKVSFTDGLEATIEWELANQPGDNSNYDKEDETLRELGLT